MCNVYYLISDVKHSRDVEKKPNPKEFDLILAYDCNKSGNPDDRQNVYNIVRATRDHGAR